MNEAVSRRTRIEGLLRGALDRDELTLHYQPVRRIGTGEVVAAEALLRWQLPDGEDLTPDEFVPVAEEAGLIAPLGEWVLRRACLQHRTWTDRGLRSLRLSVNVSTHQLRRADFANLVRETLRETGMSPGSLDLEITESAVLEHDEVTGATLAALANLGVGLTLDDFGTGYSSLSYLRRVSFDRLKIDRVFVTDPSQGVPDLALAAAVVTLAHGLRMQVVAEGVETRAQHDALAGVGCDQVQGYLLGQPAPPEEFERYLASDKPAAS
jgi:EAL domain-containing protein (putative c-di-GMP-specific phosphodiesterase class I)